jgi:hypothetical protein
VPIHEDEEHVVVFNDSGQPYNVPLDSITGEGEPTFHMISVDPDAPVNHQPPQVPSWIQNNTHVTMYLDGRRLRGFLSSTDKGWQFIQRTASGRSTFHLDLLDLPVSWEDQLTEGSLELGWQAHVRAYHVAAHGLREGVPHSFRKSMETPYPDRKI